jgi:hypothetical protein
MGGEDIEKSQIFFSAEIPDEEVKQEYEQAEKETYLQKLFVPKGRLLL